MKLNELEQVLLDQIEKLNDDSILESEDATRVLVERSKAISALSANVMNLNRLKLDIVKASEDSGDVYRQYLGIEDGRAK